MSDPKPPRKLPNPDQYSSEYGHSKSLQREVGVISEEFLEEHPDTKAIIEKSGPLYAFRMGFVAGFRAGSVDVLRAAEELEGSDCEQERNEDER